MAHKYFHNLSRKEGVFTTLFKVRPIITTNLKGKYTYLFISYEIQCSTLILHISIITPTVKFVKICNQRVFQSYEIL